MKQFILTLIFGIAIIGNIAFSQNAETPAFKVEKSLTGKHLTFPGKFSPTTPDVDVMVNNGVLIYRNRKELIRFFDIKSKKCILNLGAWGDYPAKYFAPYFANPDNDSLYCYMSDEGNVYKIYKNNGAIEKTKQRIYSWEYESGGNLVLLVHDFEKLNDSTWIFAGKSNNGFSLFTSINRKKKVDTKEFYPLNIYKDKKDWQPYTGNLILSPDNKIAVYAYEYYHVLQFVDLSTKKSKLVRLPGKEYDYKTIHEADQDILNVLHYRSCYAGKKYIYALYIGRDFAQTIKDNLNKNTYVYIEQFDWKGNSIQRMKLDKFGYFLCVDEDNNKIYLTSKSSINKSPFYEYEIPIIK